LTWGETDYTQAEFNGQRRMKADVSPSRPMAYSAAIWSKTVLLFLLVIIRFLNTQQPTFSLLF